MMAPADDSARARAPRSHALALGLAIAAVVAIAFYAAFFPLLAIAAVGGIVAIALSIGAYRRGEGRPVVAWTIVLAAVGAVVDIVLVIVSLVLLVGPAGPSRVELQAGGEAFTVEFEDDSVSYSQEWKGDDWFQRYPTERSWAEVTVTRDADAGGPIECRILWNGRLVVEETSNDDSVTCRYDR
jgi:hypothetical protein